MAVPPMVAANALRLGFRFEPTPRLVVTYYLPLLIAGEPMHAAIRPYIHAANIYACAPGTLAAQFQPTPSKDDRFFFTTVERQKNKTGKGGRYVRVAGPGSWVYQKGDPVKDDAGVKVGEIRKLRYRIGGVYTDWLMEEYVCVVKGAVDGDKERAFCRIYVSPNANADSPARQESAAFFAPPPEPVVPAPAVTRKRPAPLILKPPCPKRIQGSSSSLIRPSTSPRPGTPRPHRTGAMVPTLMHQSCSPQTQCGGMGPTLMQPARLPARTRPSTFHTTRPMIQPGRAPAIAPLQPSQQPKSFVPAGARAYYHVIPQPPQTAVPAPPVKQEQLAPPTASSDHSLPMVDNGFDDYIRHTESSLSAREVDHIMPAEAEDDDLDVDLINSIESALLAAEADGDTQQIATPSDDVLGVNKQGHQLLPPQYEADDDDIREFANSLDDILAMAMEEEGHQQVPPPQKEARKFLDPFEAACADEED